MRPECCRADYDALFDDRTARRELAAYRRRGASGTTRSLLDAIRASDVDGATVLDVGGGVGIIGVELLDAGASRLVGVDASRAYLAAARSEIERRGHAERATFHYGDFVELAAAVDPADVVTLDRVVCCYGDWTALLDASSSRSRRLYGLVIPRDRWWSRAIAAAGNLGLRLFRQRFRFYIHPEDAIDARLRRSGFERIHADRRLVWQALLYRRTAA